MIKISDRLLSLVKYVQEEDKIMEDDSEWK